MARRSLMLCPVSAAWFLVALIAPPAEAQTPASALVDTGKVEFRGSQASYLVRTLPLNSFPELPQTIADALAARNCLIPQTYEAHRPENVIHGSFQRPGSADWAVLCSSQGSVSLLVFFAGTEADKPEILATHPLADRLQPHDTSGVLGFNWGIDTATPQQVHEAQTGMAKRPQPPAYDCLADSTLDQRTRYRFYKDGEWETVQTE